MGRHLVWEATTWRKLDNVIEPPARDVAILVYDPNLDHTVLFGGIANHETLFNDTWILKGETWERMKTSNAPSQRQKAAAFYDPVRKSIILYGGEGLDSIHADMWELVLPGGNQP